MYNRKHVPTIFVSDVHLGTELASAEKLLDFLQSHTCDELFLVGDIVDGWRGKSNFHWPQSHTDVIQEIVHMSMLGTKVTYVTGNHDEFLRRYSGLELGSFKLTDEAEYTTKAGQKLLVIHGDQFDFVSKSSRWLAMVGDLGYRFLFSINHWLNKWRSRYGYEYWSLSDWAKSRVKRVVNFLGKFEKLVAQECNQRGFQGIVCGHIHKPEISDINGTKYYNCGDWVESCSALIEDETGQLEIYRWQEHDSQVITFPTSRAVGE